MKTINLVYPDKSDIKYEIYKFPDGQQNLVITSQCWDHSSDRQYFHKTDSVQIKSRLRDWKDLELITATVASLRKLKIKEIHLYVPYLLGARSDRQFEEGGNSYLVDVLAPVINSLNFESVTVMDVHSDVAAACIKNLKIIDNWKVVDFFFENNLNSNYLLVSPDAGALKKIYKIADNLAYTDEIIICSKLRNAKGELSDVVVPIKEDETKDIIIIDDICDGGATFKNISGTLNNAGHKGKKYLIVTHGVFSKNFKELSWYFDGIYCTNSYSDIDHEAFNHHLGKNCGVDIVKQINIF